MNLVLLISALSLAEAYLSNGLLSISITRHHKGDIFTTPGGKCYKDFCVSVSSGSAAPTGNGDCECKCAASRPVFRDDLNICVDDIQECSLIPFASGSVTQKIPYVFLPLKGQIVYPSADITISDVEAPVCVVSGGQFLGQSGWLNLRNSSGTETPFRLFRDEGRTYLQWLGETSMRMAMEGRIILVHLMCKDASAIEEPKVFTPCISFRVAGNPSVKEMMFTTDVHLKEHGGSLSMREYVAIGVCSLLLAVVYVAAVALYLYIRRRKRKNGSKPSGKNTTLTLGEEGIIKSNPLLQAARHLSSSGQDNAGYVSESNSCCSDTDRTSEILCLDDEDLVGPQNMQTAALIHPCDLDYGEPVVSQDPNNMEKLPEENVSIVETLEVREHPETVKGMGYGNGRRKLYFNPSYFEPDLLKAPPPAAVEFLIKIREVIAIAKHKMSAKKFSPSLLGIPEEDNGSKTDHNSSLSGRKGTPIAERCTNDTKTPHLETVPPQDFHFFPSELCWPSDTKQKIIRKWLEDVPFTMMETDEFKAQKNFSLESKSKVVNKSKLWQMNEKYSCCTESIPSPPARQDRRKTKGRAPPVPPLKVESKPENNVVPPQPPPMPAFNHNSDEIPRVQGKDCVPPTIAKNLMDAVIQELTTFKKNDKNSKLRDLPGKINDTWQENKECLSNAGEQETDAGPAIHKDVIKAGDNLPDVQNAVPTAPQDDHEYEIILLNADQPSGGGKEMKIYNLPEILSKNDRSEGYSLVSEVYVNDGYSCCSGESPPSSCSNVSVESDNVHYDVPNEKPGRLTIHVSDSPDRYKTHAESDNFEPDTLDRKPRRSRLVAPNPDDSERYSNQKFHDMECCMNSYDSDKFTDSLERPSIMLRTNGTFKRNSLQNNIDDLLRNFSWNKVEGFGSLREIYEAKSRNPKRKKETSSLIELGHGDHDRTSTLSWGEERRNKLLHRGIVLHINEEGSRRKRRESRLLNQPKVPSKPPRPSPTPRSRSASPVVSPNCASPTFRLPLSPRSLSPPLPPPRSLPSTPPPRSVTVSPPPRLTSSPSPQPQPRPHSMTPSPTPADRRKASISPLPHSPPNPTHTLKTSTPPPCSSPPPSHSSPALSSAPTSPLPPPRPPKTVSNSPVLPPRNTKPPLPPKNLKKHPKPGKFAGRPLPPLPRPTKDSSASPPTFCRDPDTLSTLSGASMDSLNSSDYEAFYMLPYAEDEDVRPGGNARNFPGKSKRPVSNPITILRSPTNNPQRRIPSQTSEDANNKPSPSTNKSKPYRPEDSGYLSTDSDSCCPQFAFPPHFSGIPENGSQNSETDESLCDGASESGGESIATDSFFYGNFNSKSGKTSEDNRDGQQMHPCALRLSDVEVNSDTERRCVPIMVRP